MTLNFGGQGNARVPIERNPKAGPMITPIKRLKPPPVKQPPLTQAQIEQRISEYRRYDKWDLKERNAQLGRRFDDSQKAYADFLRDYVDDNPDTCLKVQATDQPAPEGDILCPKCLCYIEPTDLVDPDSSG